MKEEYSYITMIERANLILEELYKSPVPLGISEISKNLDLPKATIYRILITLIKGGFVEKDSIGDKYKLGTIYIKYSDKVKSEMDIYTICKPFMEELAENVGETINLAIPYENNALNLRRVEGEATALVSKLIATAPLYCSSVGKVMLAHKSDKEIEDYFNNEKIDLRTINTIKNIDEFKVQKDFIIRNGYVFDDEEYDYGLFCIACPVFNIKNDVIAAISISGPKSRIQYKGVQKIIDELKIKVDEINKKVKEIRF